MHKLFSIKIFLKDFILEIIYVYNIDINANRFSIKLYKPSIVERNYGLSQNVT